MVLPDSNTKILFTSAYVRHRFSFPVDDFSKTFAFNVFCIIAGDSNTSHIAWNCKTNNKFGKEVLNFVKNRPDITLYHPNLPTHYSFGYPSISDLTLLKNVPYKISIEKINLFNSDYMPVLLHVDLKSD